jgi:hypothetical protein
MSFEIKDNKGRVLVHMNRKGRLALSRYPDLNEKEITNLVKVYHELSGDDVNGIEKFLRYENEDEKFCS